jgi:hypothetical protein
MAKAVHYPKAIYEIASQHSATPDEANAMLSHVASTTTKRINPGAKQKRRDSFAPF